MGESVEYAETNVGVEAWWLGPMQESLRPEVAAKSVSLESLLIRAIQNSPQIKVFSELPLIRETAITEADAAFDWYAFLDSRWDQTNDPVGSLLTGVPLNSRYENHQFSDSMGVRRRTLIGGKLEAAQKFGLQDTNSTFFLPNPQGTSRIALSYTQPVLRGAGTCYNKSLICLAKVDTDVAEQEFSRQLQSHLLEVARAFWTLHVERASALQKMRSLSRARTVVELLEQRREIDAVYPQIQRAEAELATRRADVTRAIMSVRNAEARIRSLVADPDLGTFDSVELVPLDQPTLDQIPVEIEQSMARAVVHRPEIAQALDQLKAGYIRLGMSRKELLPVLNLVTETYVAGLAGSGNVGKSWDNQFTMGRPSYSLGAQFEAPLGNRAARARNDRRVLELRQLRSQYETTLKTLRYEVGVSVREVIATYDTILSQGKAVEASYAQLRSLERRWELLPGEDGNAALILENMLQAQSRLTKAEYSYLTAWVSYNLSLVNLKRATGELLQEEQISWGEYRSECEGIKTRVLIKEER